MPNCQTITIKLDKKEIYFKYELKMILDPSQTKDLLLKKEEVDLPVLTFSRYHL